jgi:hypothetical protein
MSLHQHSNDNGVRIVNFATSKNLVVKSMMFPHRDIHKYTWTSPDGKTQNQIDHILKDRRRQSNILDVRSFRGDDCDTDYYLVVAKVREKLAVSKQAAQNFEGERFNIRKLNEPGGPGSSVGIETGYGLDGPGIESWWGRDLSHTSRPALRPTQPPVQWVPGLSRG